MTVIAEFHNLVETQASAGLPDPVRELLVQLFAEADEHDLKMILIKVLKDNQHAIDLDHFVHMFI